jgi:aspartyl-tRNA(Asn)/glutamyl-tRNA(Gln) amidotransferase subunit A
VKITPEKALQMAEVSDARLASGKAGALEGIPLGIKDLFATEGIHTQACSHILDGFKPHYESTVTQNLWDDGAVMLGKLNMDEFAMGSSNETSYYGAGDQSLACGGLQPAARSRRLLRWLGAAVAAHLCAGATATDTGGSIRQPAAFTGTVGIKPTYGRCSRWGIVAFRLLARPGRPDCPRRARCRDDAEIDGQRRCQGHDLGRSSGAGLRGCLGQS